MTECQRAIKIHHQKKVATKNFDSWMEKLLAVTPRPGRAVIIAADLMHRKAGDNPHLWYDPRTMPAVAGALAAALAAADPAHKNEYAARLKTFLASLSPLDERIAAIRAKYAGTPVTATEPVFDDMAAALDLKMHDARSQLAVMNGGMHPQGLDDSLGGQGALERGLSRHDLVQIGNERA